MVNNHLTKLKDHLQAIKKNKLWFARLLGTSLVGKSLLVIEGIVPHLKYRLLAESLQVRIDTTLIAVHLI